MSRRKRAPGTRTEVRKERQTEVAKLLCAWVSYNEICNRIQARWGVCRDTVEKDIASIRKRWRKESESRDREIVFDQVFNSLAAMIPSCKAANTPVDRRTARSIILYIAKLYGIIERQGEVQPTKVVFDWGALPVDDGEGPIDEEKRDEYLAAVKEKGNSENA